MLEAVPLKPLVLVANARMPSQRAQSLQVAQVAASFARAGLPTTLLHALRRDTAPIEDSERVWDFYAVPKGARADLRGAACRDFIDAVPRRWQYLPARWQELSFAGNAARLLEDDFAGARVISREIEVARLLVSHGRGGVFLELHRVPAGRLRRRWLLEAARGVAGVVAISGGVRADLIELGLADESIVVAHDGFEPERFARLPSRAEAREALGLDADRQVVVYTGGLLAWKGVDILVQAARRLPAVQFVIVGGMNADVEALAPAARAAGNVRLDGFKNPTRVPLYLAAADVGAVPNRSRPAISSRYTSPLKIFEAMAVGLPLVVSDLFSMRDVLDPDQAEFVAADDAEALAAGLARVLGDDDLRRGLAQRIRGSAAQATWDGRAQRLVAWMDERDAD